MIKFRSLRSRLLVAFSALSLLVCVFFIRLSTLLIETSQMNAYQSVLAQEESRLLSNPSAIKTSTTSLQSVVLYRNMLLVPNAFINAMGERKSGSFESVEGQTFVFRSFLVDDQQHLLLLNVDAFASNRHLSQYKSLFLFSISISAFILCILSAWYLSKWLSNPIQTLTQEVEETGRLRFLSSPDETNENALYGTDREDEIGKLAVALQYSYAEIQSLLKREQNFTRDVSHELRTPITLIKNTLEMQRADTLNHDEKGLLKQAAKELEDTVEILLALARQENLVFTELKVLPIVEKAVLTVYRSYPDFVFDATLNVDPKMTAKGNALLLTLLCQNLVNNGFYHGNGRGMNISSENNKIVFENGVDQSQKRPYYQGLGHGQYLVRRIIEAMHWSLDIQHKDDFYRVTITTTRD